VSEVFEPTAQDFQQAILALLGEEPDSDLAEQLPAYWEICEITGRGYTGLQYLFTLKQAILFLLGRLRTEFDVSDSGASQTRSQKFRQTESMLDAVDKDIASFQDLLKAGAAPEIGLIERDVIFPATGLYRWADPNSRLYRGDAVVRRGWT
jgi:hypothetical protein